MKIRVLVLLVATVLAFPSAHAARTWSGQGPFHPSQTVAEKALDRALTNSSEGKRSMTSSLLKFVTQLEDQKQNGTCTRKSGGFLDTLLCENFDIDRVITCGRVPRNVSYVYQTISSSDTEAVVEAVWAQSVSVGTPHWNTYHLIMDKTSWKVDGIDCGGLYKYNISRKSLLDKFHIATSDPEKALEKILRLNQDESVGLYGFVYGYRTHELVQDKELSLLFTKAFLERSRKEEKALVTESCDGKYPEGGGACDMIRGTDPIRCTQDLLEDYVYHTENLGKNEVTVTYAWPYAAPAGPAYKMVHRKGHWALDAISCEGYGEFLRP